MYTCVHLGKIFKNVFFPIWTKYKKKKILKLATFGLNKKML